MSNDVHIQGDVQMTPSQPGHEDRFLGMTKLQFLGLVLTLVFLTSISSTFSVAYSIQANAARIKSISANTARMEALVAQNKGIGCAVKAGLMNHIAESQAYLKMTPAERVAKYGPALGATPEEFVKVGIDNDQRLLDPYKTLQCEEG